MKKSVYQKALELFPVRVDDSLEDSNEMKRTLFMLGGEYGQNDMFALMSEYAYYVTECYTQKPMITPFPPSKWYQEFKTK
jgi:hypothetical protein